MRVNETGTFIHGTSLIPRHRRSTLVNKQCR
jgi:hypothetical protein